MTHSKIFKGFLSIRSTLPLILHYQLFRNKHNEYFRHFCRGLKQSCVNHLDRDENGSTKKIEKPDGEFDRSAQVQVIANSEELRFSLR